MSRVVGSVRNDDAAGVDNLTVVAYDRRVPSPSSPRGYQLGRATTNDSGQFRIEYNEHEPGGPSRPMRGGVNLGFRVFGERGEHLVVQVLPVAGEPVDAAVTFSAPVETEVELHVLPATPISEWERLVTQVDAVAEGAALDRLSAEDMQFISAWAHIDPALVRLAAEATRVAGLLGVHPEAVYGLARAGIRVSAEAFGEAGESRLRAALGEAIEAGFIPTAYAERVDGVARVLARGGRPPVRVVLRVVEPSGGPLAHRVVRAADLDADLAARDLGFSVTDARGEAVFSYFAPAGAAAHRIAIELPAAPSRRAPEAGVSVGTESGRVVREDAGPLSGTVTPDLDAPHTVVVIETGLTRLDADQILESEFVAGIEAIADTERGRFVARAGEEIGDYAAARRHAAAVAGRRYLDAMVTASLRPAAAPRSLDVPGDSSPSDPLVEDGCSSAVGPLAYYIDLLRYVTEHLRTGTGPVTSDFLSARFLQDFHGLAADCAAVEDRVSQVRLVIESLQRLPLSFGSDADLRLRAAPGRLALDAAEARYRLASYEAALAQLGTSFGEVRRARGDEAARVALAGRLGVSLTVPAPPGGDEISRLVLDPSSISETELTDLFGIGFGRSRLTRGADTVVEDMVLSWTAENVVFGRDTSRDGSIFVAFSLDGSSVRIEAFADETLSRRVAVGQCDLLGGVVALTPVPGGGPDLIVEVNDLDLVFGEFGTGVEDPPPPTELVVFPRVVGWRLTRLRELWQAEDLAAGEVPAIDPDLVPASMLVGGLSGTAGQLWVKRAEQLAARATRLSAMPAAADSAARFSALLREGLRTTPDALAALARRRQQGEDVSADLAGLGIGPLGLAYLDRIREITAASQPVLSVEWADVIDVLLAAFRASLATTWSAEERVLGLTLSPDHLRSTEAAAVVPPGPFRATVSEFQRRLDIIRRRMDQEAGVLAAHGDAVAAVEEATLPGLRDALLVATAPPDMDLASAATTFTETRFADAQASGSQSTTRVAHAIETLQGIIEAVRSDRYRGTPALELNAAAFENDWRWMSSYETWRAARFAYLYPENLVLPDTHDPASPGFRALLDTLGSGPLSRQKAAAEADRYAAYFTDVCTLQVEASCSAYGRTPHQTNLPSSGLTYRPMLYLFGRATSGAVYWSAADPWNPTWQRYWQRVPHGEGLVSKVIGATPYQLPTGERWLYLFVKRLIGIVEQLVYIRMDLDTHEWEPERVLDLPAAARSFDALLVARSETSLGLVPASWNLSVAPQLLIRVRQPGADSMWWERQLAAAGDGWEPDPFCEINIPTWSDVHVVADQGNNALYTVYQQGPDLRCALFTLLNGRALTGSWRYAAAGAQLLFDQTYRGALVFQNASASVWFTNDLYIVTRSITGEMRTTMMGRGSTPNQVTLVAVVGEPELPAVTIPASAGNLYNDWVGFENWFAFTRDDQPGREFYGRVLRSAPGAAALLDVSLFARPPVTGPFDLGAPMGAAALQARRSLIATAYAAVGGSAQSVPDAYLLEMYFLAPVAIALNLLRSGEHRAALDWLRLVYDVYAPVAQRKIAYLLTREETHPDMATGAAVWLSDPLSPHRIALTRRNCYTRFTMITIARCLNAIGDAEFATDTAESLPRARVAYQTAQALATAPEIAVEESSGATAPNPSDDTLPRSPVIAPRDRRPRHRLQPVPDGTRRASSGVPTVGGVLDAATADAAARRRTIADTPAGRQALTRIAERVRAEYDRWVPLITGTSLASLESADTRLAWLRTPRREPGDAAEREAEGGVAAANRTVSRAPSLAELNELALRDAEDLGAAAASTPQGAMELLIGADAVFVPFPPTGFRVAPNPVLQALFKHAELSLVKLRSGRNSAGVKRQIEPYSAPTDTTSGMPTVSGTTVVAVSATGLLLPAQYRYSVLLERSRQLVQLAAQVEAQMLHTIEAGEAEDLTRLRAQQEVTVTRAAVQLHTARIAEAAQEVQLATLQQARAQQQVDVYDAWLAAGLIEWEERQLEAYRDEEKAELGVIAADMSLEIFRALTTAAAGGATGAVPAAAMAALVSIAAVGRAGFQGMATMARTNAAVAGIRAGIERRTQEWSLQRTTALQDVTIGGQQIAIARAGLETTNLENAVAQLHADNARDTVAFLRAKFLDAALYAWMSGELESTYAYLLQQATAMARLAEQQLAFERQEVPPIHIQQDYWTALAGGTTGAAGDRRGLTGSARLLEDIERLDQVAFLTARRKLQVTRVLSMAQLVPLEFQEFKRTGVLPFATTEELFDRDFPGHYLRIVRRVRVTMIALVPPSEGIRTTLSNTGVSRVVLGPDLFRTSVLRREPQSVALSSAVGASGVFDLDLDPQMLAPFEGSGVDTTWELRMPKAANPFDFSTIADVLVTIDYTALHSYDRAAQVQRSLPRDLHGTRAFGFRTEFADAWYDLHNADRLPSEQRLRVRVRTGRADFPPNTSKLEIESVVLAFVLADGVNEEVEIERFVLTVDGDSQPAPSAASAATTHKGLVSTRRANGSAWTSIVGNSPVGVWELQLADTPDNIALFKQEKIADILLVLGYRGELPEWPG